MDKSKVQSTMESKELNRKAKIAEIKSHLGKNGEMTTEQFKKLSDLLVEQMTENINYHAVNNDSVAL